MDIRVATDDPARHAVDLLIVPVAQADTPGGTAALIDAATGGHLAAAMTRGEFTGKPGQAIGFPATDTAAGRVCYVGIGMADAVSPEVFRRAAGKGVRTAQEGKFTSAAFAPLETAQPFGTLSAEDGAGAVAEGARLGAYRFNQYKTDDDSRTPDTVDSFTVLVSADAGAAAESGVRYGNAVAEGTCMANDLTNHPSAVLTPTQMAKDAVALGERYGFSVEVLEKAQMKTLGMGGMIGVSQGSEEPPKFVVMDYKGAEGDPVVLVGKSITFDSGGISIKPSGGMEEMKGDMGGGAAVLGTMQAVAELGLPIHVVGILTAAENMPSGSAQNPGDVLKMYSGLTVEVINTDAEGRLVLADGLAYANDKLSPRLMIDIATLTGACVVALGHHAIGMLGTDEAAKRDLSEIGEATGERVWELPLWEEYEEDLKSDIADLKNTGGRAGGTITAACFLKRFVGDSPWVHLDIASTAWSDKASDYLPKGGRGTGVRLMTGLLKKLSNA
ncbi:MAG: leucyl aminopeptidase [Leptospirillia bacterium]